MFLDDLRSHCIQKPGASEGLPFDEKTLVFKVFGKMFALMDVEIFDSVNLKCDPEWAIELRERFQAVRPGFHMNNKHWNTVTLTDDINDKFLLELVDHSYHLVYAGLSKKIRDENPL